MTKPFLYIFSGLPGVGKSTLAKLLTQQINAAYIRIDTIEQGLRDLCDYQVEGEGYRLAYRLASDNLLLGNTVVADSCNPIELTRREWQNVAIDSGANWLNLEVLCSDPKEHKHRVESRLSEIKNLGLPSWQSVINREFVAWNSSRVILDTVSQSVEESFQELMAAILKISLKNCKIL